MATFYSKLLLCILGAGVWYESVAYTSNSEKVARFAGVAFDVTAQTNDEIVDGSRVGVFVQIPDILQSCLRETDYGRCC